MRVVHVAPTEALAPYVERLTIVESDHGGTRSLLPDTGLVLGFRYRGAAVDLSGEARRLPEASLAGMRSRARRMQTLPQGGIVLATFRAGRAARFFREPLHELFGATVALADLVPEREVAEVRERVAGAPDDAARFAELEGFLLARGGARPLDRVVDQAARAIIASHGAVRVGGLARDAGLSRDRFEKRFRAAVGTSPKRLASIVRLREAVAQYAPGASLARIAVAVGYVDQAHFTRDFGAFTGTPPKRFFESVDHC